MWGCVRSDVFLSFLEKASDVLLRVQSSDKVTSISLPAAPAYHVIEFELEVLSLPSAPVTGGESGVLGMTESQRKHKDSRSAGRCMATAEHKVRRGWRLSAREGGLCPLHVRRRGLLVNWQITLSWCHILSLDLAFISLSHSLYIRGTSYKDREALSSLQ